MKVEDFFDFLADDDVRIKGSRVGIESVLYEYIHRGQTAEQITERFPTLRLEQIYATILYYLLNREKVDAYLLDGLNFGRRMREKQAENPPPAVSRLIKLKAEKSLLTV